MNLLDANDPSGGYPSSWYVETSEMLAPLPAISGEARTEVAIVGGGYTGLSAALDLAEAGREVVLLEAQRLGFGASGRNGGQVGSGQRLEQAALERELGLEPARRLWDIAEEAKARVRALIARHEIEAEWQPGIVHAIRAAGDLPQEHANAAKLAEEYGYAEVETLDAAALARLIGTEAFAGGTLDRGAGHLHPLRFALGLARAARGAGATLHERSRVQALEGRTLRGAGFTLKADHVLLACNGYLGRLAPVVASRVMPINNFILATEPLGARMPLAAPVAVADDRFVVNYWRPTPDGRLLFGGGESYGYRFPRDIERLVRRPMTQIYPQLADVPVSHAWGGTLAVTMNRMPHFAEIGPGVLSASGYSGHGVAMAVMAGRLMAEKVAGRGAGFDLMARVPLRPFPGGAQLRSPLLTLAMGWYALRDRIGH